MRADESGPGGVGDRLLRLHGRPGEQPQGWVPTAPESPDVRAVRERAQSTAITAYTAVHGHPLDHPEPGAGGRRWGMRTRVAVAGSVAVLALGGFVVLRSGQVASVMVDGGSVVDAGGSLGDGEDGSVVGAVGGEASGETTEPFGGPMPGSPSATHGDAGHLVVHVVGEVEHPGVVRLDDGARVAEAVEAAGGVTTGADLTGVNLARRVVDGEQIVVPAPGEPVAAATSGPGPIDLNGASVQDLDELPGIGTVLAERIVQWRTTHGRFTSVDELAEVSGIGPALLSDLRDLVRV